MSVSTPSSTPAVEPPAAPAGRLTASMLFYAFANRVAPPAGRLDKAKAVPCAGPDVKVQQDALATTLVHAALWDLGRRGVIRLEEVEKKVLFVKTKSLKVRPSAGSDPSAEPADSLEFDLLQAALRRGDDGDVRSVVRALYPKDVEDPFRRAIGMANVAEINAGLVRLDVEERSGIGRVLGKKERLVWQCDVIAAHRDDFAAIVRDWNRDHDADPAAFDRLATEIRRAIASREHEERGSIFDD
ncbi:MAG TPA: hypothetical protein VKR30_06855 [Candidatus Limnocylindrales bacterium]|nr:hypothetical protein [Candidatus Limnocylindrales bacterium]